MNDYELLTGLIGSSSKENENRLPLHPEHLLSLPPELKEMMVVERGYGGDFGCSDEVLVAEGFILGDRETILKTADIIVLPKPTTEDLKAMKEGATLWGWPHCVQNFELTQIAIERNLTLIAWEAMHEWDGSGEQKNVHSFHRNNQIAGYAGVAHALSLVGENGYFGNPSKAVVLGYGSCGNGAVRALKGLGYNDITVLTNRNVNQLPDRMSGVIHLTMRKNSDQTIEYLSADQHQVPLIELLSTADTIVNCVLQDTDNPTNFVLENEVGRLKRDCLIIDISCDEKMGFSFAQPTSFENPMIRVDHINYYAVDHTPSYFWKSATWENSLIVRDYLPVVMAGADAWSSNRTICRAIEIVRGAIVNPKILSFQNRLPYRPYRQFEDMRQEFRPKRLFEELTANRERLIGSRSSPDHVYFLDTPTKSESTHQVDHDKNNRQDLRSGSLAPSFDPNHDRVRGFLDVPVHCYEDLESFLGELEGKRIASDASRITFRCIVGMEALDEVKGRLDQNGYRLEANIPLSGRWRSYHLTYFGKNSAGRQSIPEVMTSQDILVNGVKSRPYRDLMDTIKRTRAQGVRIERLCNEISTSDRSQLEEMFRHSLPGSKYDFAANLDAMLSDRDNQFMMAARHVESDRLLYLLVGEMRVVPTPNGDLSIFEIHCSVKADIKDNDGLKFSSSGLNLCLWIAMLSEAKRIGVDLFYGESRAALGAINCTTHYLQMKYRGRLIKSVITNGIEDVTERDLDHHTPYVNLNVWAMNHSEISGFDDHGITYEHSGKNVAS